MIIHLLTSSAHPLSYAYPPGTISSIKTLQLVSHSFRLWSTPLLYQKIVLDSKQLPIFKTIMASTAQYPVQSLALTSSGIAGEGFDEDLAFSVLDNVAVRGLERLYVSEEFALLLCVGLIDHTVVLDGLKEIIDPYSVLEPLWRQTPKQRVGQYGSITKINLETCKTWITKDTEFICWSSSNHWYHDPDAVVQLIEKGTIHMINLCSDAVGGAQGLRSSLKKAIEKAATIKPSVCERIFVSDVMSSNVSAYTSIPWTWLNLIQHGDMCNLPRHPYRTWRASLVD